jgi:hypothetical protein
MIKKYLKFANFPVSLKSANSPFNCFVKQLVSAIFLSLRSIACENCSFIALILFNA